LHHRSALLTQQPQRCHLPLATYPRHLSHDMCYSPPATCHLPCIANLPVGPQTGLHLSTTGQSLMHCHLPPVTCHLPPATCHLPHVTCHLPPVTFYMPPASCHLPPANCPSFLLTSWSKNRIALEHHRSAAAAPPSATCHLLPNTCHLSHATCHLSHATYDLSHATCLLPPTTCHLPCIADSPVSPKTGLHLSM
jgi:hypothetical protein